MKEPYIIRMSAEPFKPNWLNISFVVPMHLLGLIAWPIYVLMGGGIQWGEIFVFIIMFTIGAIGVDVGYHRGFSHRAFKMNPILKFFVLFGGSSVAEGSLFTWASDHRRHHKFQDTDQDPYNIKRGFWWAHMGWILGNKTSTDFKNIPDLTKDPLFQNQHKYYAIWLLASCFLLPLGLGFLFDRPLAGFLLGGFTRLMFIDHCTYLINSYAHYFGRRPYSVDITARDSLICAIFAQGEGWHNFHHKFPWDFRNGHRFYHYDPAKWFIMLAHKLGWATDLKETPEHEILRARIQTQMRVHQSESPIFHGLAEKMNLALNEWQHLSLKWDRFKHETELHTAHKIDEIKASIQEARQNFRASYAEWRLHLKQAAGQGETSEL